jgi:hypothetical protein
MSFTSLMTAKKEGIGVLSSILKRMEPNEVLFPQIITDHFDKEGTFNTINRHIEEMRSAIMIIRGRLEEEIQGNEREGLLDKLARVERALEEHISKAEIEVNRGTVNYLLDRASSAESEEERIALVNRAVEIAKEIDDPLLFTIIKKRIADGKLDVSLTDFTNRAKKLGKDINYYDIIDWFLNSAGSAESEEERIALVNRAVEFANKTFPNRRGLSVTTVVEGRASKIDDSLARFVEETTDLLKGLPVISLRQIAEDAIHYSGEENFNACARIVRVVITSLCGHTGEVEGLLKYAATKGVKISPEKYSSKDTVVNFKYALATLEGAVRYITQADKILGTSYQDVLQNSLKGVGNKYLTTAATPEVVKELNALTEIAYQLFQKVNAKLAEVERL